MLDKLNHINHTFLRLNNLEKKIILTLVVILPIAYQLGIRQYRAIAWEKKERQCDKFSFLSKQASDNEQWELSTYLFESGMQCIDELGKMNYADRIFD